MRYTDPVRPAWLISLFVLAGCKHGRDSAPDPDELVERGWHAHDLGIAAGEHAATCPEAGAAMRRVLADHHQELADAFAIDRDPEQLAKIVDYLEAHQERLDELARRTDDLRRRCANEPTVLSAFRDVQPP